MVFIAVKPHLYQGMLSRLQDQGRRYGDKLWVSIMAGVVLTDLTAAVNSVTKDLASRIVRSIPNTPVKVRKGSIGVTLSEGCSSQDREVVLTLFSSVGRCVEIPERLQNSFAAMAGSGPAYIYQVITLTCQPLPFPHYDIRISTNKKWAKILTDIKPIDNQV